MPSYYETSHTVSQNKQHNCKLLQVFKEKQTQMPLPSKCNTEYVIYTATVTSDNCVKTYIG